MASADTSRRKTPRARVLGFRVALVLGGLTAGGLIAEEVVRSGQITPARQIVRNNNIRSIQGVPIWDPDPARANIACVMQHPQRQRILFFGNSITYGAGVRATETFAALLEERLNAARPDPGFCVMNLAVPAFRFGQKFAMATEAIPRYRATMALYQDWDMEWGGVGCPASGEYPPEYARLGNAVFGTMGLRLRHDGLPGMASVPDPLNHLLFSHSYLYQYLTLAEGEPAGPLAPCPHGQSEFRVFSLRRFTALARSVGAKPVFYLAADLTYPLRETHPRELAEEQPILDMGAADGVPVIRLRELLADQDNTAIRMDSWHFNPAGHRVLAERFERIVLDGLAPHTPP
jgi:hypothetical protein